MKTGLRWAIVVAIFCGSVCAAASAQETTSTVTIRFDNLSDFVTSPEVVCDSKANALRLAGSVLLTDEMGATDWLQGEALSDRVQAKKVFQLDSPGVTSAELFIFGSAKHLEVNGENVAGMERLVATGWTRAKVPVEHLKAGGNEFRLWGGGSLLVEPSKQPGRSAKSTDGGKSWSKHNLSSKSNQQGEYLIRLRLGRYAPRGWTTSPVLDLWGGDIGRPAKVSKLTLNLGDRPKETSIEVFVRTGPSPDPDEKSWTRWIRMDQRLCMEAVRPVKPGAALPRTMSLTMSLPYGRRFPPPLKFRWEAVHSVEREAARHRWAQIKFELATDRAQQTPSIESQVTLTAELNREKLPVLSAKVKSNPPRPPASGVAFVYEGPSPRLKFLREKYKLDQVIAPGKTEMEQLMLLRYWVRNQWHTAWQSHPAGWMPPWDSLIILQSKDQPDCLTMCTHYACVFTQCAQALGWNARHCILDHHCVSEVYVNQHDKWVMMDTGNSPQRADVGLHFEKEGVPLSARELHLAQRGKKTAGIRVCFTPAKLAKEIARLCRPAPKHPKEARPDSIPIADLPKYPVCGIANYRRYAFPPRNTFLTSLYPGELYQGYSEYYYDGYCWVGDSPDDPTISPEYSLHADPARPQQADWKLNWTHAYLSYTQKPNELRVDLATPTPNLERLEMKREYVGLKGRVGGTNWRVTPASFAWKLEPGENTLTIRSVNQWGKAGPESRVAVSLPK